MNLQQNEWLVLSETPVAAFSLIATADGAIDERERLALMTLARYVAKAAAAYFGLGAATTEEEQAAINALGHLLTSNKPTIA